jgi:hypothetical protein
MVFYCFTATTCKNDYSVGANQNYTFSPPENQTSYAFGTIMSIKCACGFKVDDAATSQNVEGLNVSTCWGNFGWFPAKIPACVPGKIVIFIYAYFAKIGNEDPA